MYCKYCGREQDDDALYCADCGGHLVAETSALKTSASPEPPSLPPADVQPSQKPAESGALILGLLSVAFCLLNYLGVPFVHIVGLILASLAISKSAKEFNTAKHAKLAFVLGIVGLVLAILSMVIGIFIGVMYGV